MLIFTYPIIVLIISLFFKTRQGYPKIIAVSLFTAILGFIVLILVSLNMINFLNLDDTILYSILNYGGILLYVLSFVCLLWHFFSPYIGSTVKGVLSLFTNLLSLSIIFLIGTVITQLYFNGPSENSHLQCGVLVIITTFYNLYY